MALASTVQCNGVIARLQRMPLFNKGKGKYEIQVAAYAFVYVIDMQTSRIYLACGEWLRAYKLPTFAWAGRVA